MVIFNAKRKKRKNLFELISYKDDILIYSLLRPSKPFFTSKVNSFTFITLLICSLLRRLNNNLDF